jgi:hypothetical protein
MSNMKHIHPVQTKVTATLPGAIELTKLNSVNGLEIQIKTGQNLLGTLLMGRGSVIWWPKGHKVNAARKTWKQFAAMLNESME